MLNDATMEQVAFYRSMIVLKGSDEQANEVLTTLPGDMPPHYWIDMFASIDAPTNHAAKADETTMQIFRGVNLLGEKYLIGYFGHPDTATNPKILQILASRAHASDRYRD
jgi:hypothetical protein